MKTQRDFRQSVERSGPDAEMGGLQRRTEAHPGRIPAKGLLIKCFKMCTAAVVRAIKRPFKQSLYVN